MTEKHDKEQEIVENWNYNRGNNMLLCDLLKMLNQLAKEKPEILKMEVRLCDEIEDTSNNITAISIVSQMNHLTKKIEKYVEIEGNKYE